MSHPLRSKTIYYFTGVHEEVFSFDTNDEVGLWNAEVYAIKAESTAAFNKKESEGLTNEVRELYNNWMTRVNAFKGQFGEDRTPMDIKWALNTIERGLGLPETQWQNPPFFE